MDLFKNCRVNLQVHVNLNIANDLFSIPSFYLAAFYKSNAKLVPCKLAITVDLKNSYFWLNLRPWVEWKIRASDPRSTTLCVSLDKLLSLMFSHL